MPDDLVLDMHLDANSAVVAVTHDPKLDDLALMEALRTPAFYVGALGSRRNHDARLPHPVVGHHRRNRRALGPRFPHHPPSTRGVHG